MGSIEVLRSTVVLDETRKLVHETGERMTRAEAVERLRESFAEAAVEAVRQWRYEPARKERGRPVSVYFTVMVEFTLNSSAGRP